MTSFDRRRSFAHYYVTLVPLYRYCPFGLVRRACASHKFPVHLLRRLKYLPEGVTVKANRFFFLLLSLAAGVACATDEVQIYVLSNRADLVSGGDALVGLVIAPGADASG